MASNRFYFNVEMACTGCSNAVERSLKNLKGIENCEISLEQQYVVVWTDGSLDVEQVLNAIKKTGKAAEYDKSK